MALESKAEGCFAQDDDSVSLALEQAGELARTIFLRHGISPAHAAAMATVLCRAEADECPSHGLYRVLGCIASVQSGKVSRAALPRVVNSAAAAVTIIDAGGAFAPLALEIGRPLVIEKARQQGIAVLAIRNCYHFSALWADLESVAESGFVAISCTIGMHCVALAGGRSPALGTNPFAFAWPRGSSKPPFVFDLSTSATARGEIELRRRASATIPLGWAIDAAGEPTTDPAAALAGSLLPFGGHKGSALGLMVELLAGPLLGEPFSAVAKAIDTGDGGPYRAGYLMIVLSPAAFASQETIISPASDWLAALQRDHPTARLPSHRRYVARRRTATAGITIPRPLFEQLSALRGGT